MKKRIFALLLGVSLLCTFFAQALPVASAAEVTDFGSCGENLTWTLNTDGLLTISGTGEMEDYSFHGNVPWNGLVDKINCIVFIFRLAKYGSSLVRMMCSLVCQVFSFSRFFISAV